ncbi:MAG: type IV secretion system DNA-binding domain-containing protein [Chloroflexi bacterium]|nr:type IV secretion system DNA-binding domain-containing protein [Chloroflexota bacterium]
MMYWLLTELSVGWCLLPLLCLALPLPWLVAYLMGPSIRRDGMRDGVSGRDRWLRGIVHSLMSLMGLLVYLQLMRSVAVQLASETMISSPVLKAIAGGPPTVNQALLLLTGLGGLLLVFGLNMVLQEGLRQGGHMREQVDRWRVPRTVRGALGSSHLCTMREFHRFRRVDPDGMSLYGAFWGHEQRRLDWNTGVLRLSGEDAARGVLTIGAAGSGKSQGVILPAIADRMQSGHSLIIADPQGELQPHILDFARITGHMLIIHDPTRATGPRFNLAEGIHNVSDARAIADVLVPAATGDNRFWSDSATALLAACLLRFANLGDIYAAMNDAAKLAETLSSQADDAALLANAFVASTRSDGKVAANVIATLGTALTGWASQQVRGNTAACDFTADLLIQQPTVIVLTCPGRMRAVYAPYLGATLRKLMMDLDTLGEANGGPLPVPVGVILDEFPTLGKLDSLVADVNLVRKRRISILIGAQTKGQFHMIYGQAGTQALLAGLATQIIYGGCDGETASYYSGTAGQTTVAEEKTVRQRPLLTVDEIMTPQRGNCTIFARYVEAGFATQVVLHARLTRFYERRDWQQRLRQTGDREPLLLERGLDLGLATDYSAEQAVKTLDKQARQVKQMPVSELRKTIRGRQQQ